MMRYETTVQYLKANVKIQEKQDYNQLETEQIGS